MRKKKDWTGQEKINDPNVNYGSWNKDWDNINKWYTTQIMPEHRQDWQQNGNNWQYGGNNWPNNWQNGGNNPNNGLYNYGFNGCCIILLILSNFKLINLINVFYFKFLHLVSIME